MTITLKEIIDQNNAALGVVRGPESATDSALSIYDGTTGKLLGEAQAKSDLVAGTNEIQTITFATVPGEGSFVLDYESAQSSAIQWNDDAAAVKAAIEVIPAIDEVTVTGNFSTGFTIEFTGTSAKTNFSQFTVVSNTLEEGF